MPSSDLNVPIIIGAAVLLVIVLLWRRQRRRTVPLRLSLGEVLGREYHLRIAIDEPFMLPHGDAATKRSPALPKPPAPARQLTRIVIDSVLLSHAYMYVSRRHLPERNGEFVESFTWGGGVMIENNLFVVTQIVPVQLSRQSVAGAAADPGSSIAVLEALDNLNLVACMHFHNHPSSGRNGNRPSGIDRRFQKNLERGGSIAVGCIFSKDGFARFFADDLDRFCVEVVGANANKVGDNEFQLDLRDVPYERLVFQPRGSQ